MEEASTVRTITVAYGAEDLMEFAQAHLAPHAWQAIDDSVNQIRNYKKHDYGTADQCIDDVLFTLTSAQARLDE